MSKSNMIYLDYASSFLPNPSSIHLSGRKTKEKLEKSRDTVARFLNARKEEIVFTSGGTESDNLAIQGVVYEVLMQNFFRSSGRPHSIGKGSTRPFKNLASAPHIITTNIEHPAVLETCRILEKRGLVEVSIVPVEKNGIVDPKKIKKELKENTILVSVMYANNEIGTIQPIREIAKEIRYFKKTHQKTFLNGLAGVGDPENRGPEKKFFGGFSFPLFHTDAVQAVNYLDLNVEKLGVDLLSLSGAKIEGAGRVGVLYKKKNVPLSPIFGGGDQEFGFRPGTENILEIVKFSEAIKEVLRNREKENKRLLVLQKYFLKKLEKFNPIINGDLKNSLPNILNITFPKIPSDLLVLELSEKGIMISSKSACKSSLKEGSYVIRALHSAEARLLQDLPQNVGGLRFSLGSKTTKKDIDYTVNALKQILQKLQKWY